jgi:hypothetical protein
MRTRPDHRWPSACRAGASAKIALGLALVVFTREARADGPLVATLVPKRVFLARGYSVRSGDYFAVEPAFVFVADARPGTRPPVGVVRPIAGVGGSGLGIGLALQPIGPIAGERPQHVEDYVSILPVSLEAHVERMYWSRHWRSATYLGPQVSLSVYFLKASAGLMVNASDQRDRHAQLGIGAGF